METIKKETVEEIIRWAKEEGHIRGDIEIVIENIYNYEEKEN